MTGLADVLVLGATLTCVDNTYWAEGVGSSARVAHQHQDDRGRLFRVAVARDPRPGVLISHSISTPPDRFVTWGTTSNPATGATEHTVTWPLPIGGGHTVTYRITPPAAEETRAA